MEVTVKNCVLGKTHISKIAYNQTYNILACNIQGNDTVSFYTLNTQDNMSFIQIFKGAAKPPGSKISMTWSSDGKYLALGSGNIQLWQLKQNRIRPLKTYNQDFIQIKQIQWTVDNLSYCIGGINRNNIIRTRNIQTGKIKQIKLPENQTMSSISFDPFGKYLFVLLRNNHLEIYNTLNYQKQKTINLSPVNVKINPIREIRSGGWSPDYGNFVIPSLDDSRINISFNLSRKYDFQIRNVYMGHCSAISCCKFNPKLYKYNSDITKIFAMGDSTGNISIWRIGLSSTYPQPLLLSSSMQNSQQVVQQIQWDQTGELLIINMMKKYINLIKFNKIKDFGIELNNEEVFTLIQEMYGSIRAEDINAKQIEVFTGSVWKQDEDIYIKETNNQNNITNLNRKDGNNILNNQIIQQDKMQLQQHNESIKPIEISKQAQETKPLQKEEENIKIVQNQMISQNICVNLDPRIIPSFSQQISPLNIPQQIPALNRYSITSSTPQFIKLSQQKTIITKDNKKRIQPAMMVRKNQLNNINNSNAYTNMNINMNININKNIINNGNMNINSNNHLLQENMNMKNTIMYNNGNNSGNINGPLFCPIKLLQTLPSLSLKPISFTQKYLVLAQNWQHLQVKKSSKLTLVQVYCSDLIISHRYFPNNIDHIQLSFKYIYIINQQNLYIFDHTLNPIELPLKLGVIHKFTVDYYKDIIYYITSNGYMVGIDIQKRVGLTPAPVPVHLLIGELNSNIINNSNNINNNSNNNNIINNNNTHASSPSQSKFTNSLQHLFIRELTISQDQNVYISIGNRINQKMHQNYLYNKKMNGWVRLEYKQGKLTPGYSIRISQNQQIMNKNIIKVLSSVVRNKQYQDNYMNNMSNNNLNNMSNNMNNLNNMNNINNINSLSTLNNGIKACNLVSSSSSSILSRYQQQLLYYSRHCINNQKHQQALLYQLKHLKLSNCPHQLRSTIYQFFFNSSNNNYIKNKQRRQKIFEKVKKYIGGDIVEEFIIGGEAMSQ